MDVVIIATGLPSNGLSPYGLDAKSIAFLRTHGAEYSYSGVTIRMASAFFIFDLNFLPF
jgi:hypothetical protein